VARELKEPGTSFDFVTTPLWQSVEFRAAILENRLEFRIGEMTLKKKRLFLSYYSNARAIYDYSDNYDMCPIQP